MTYTPLALALFVFALFFATPPDASGGDTVLKNQSCSVNGKRVTLLHYDCSNRKGQHLSVHLEGESTPIKYDAIDCSARTPRFSEGRQGAAIRAAGSRFRRLRNSPSSMFQDRKSGGLGGDSQKILHGWDLLEGPIKGIKPVMGVARNTGLGCPHGGPKAIALARGCAGVPYKLTNGAYSSRPSGKAYKAKPKNRKKRRAQAWTWF